MAWIGLQSRICDALTEVGNVKTDAVRLQINRRIFGLGSLLWPKKEARDKELRSLAKSINPTGGESISALKDFQARMLVARLQMLISNRRTETRNRWFPLLRSIQQSEPRPGYATHYQFVRVAEISIELFKTPEQVEGILRSKFHIDSLQFAIPKNVMSGLLNILESYRKKSRNYYYTNGN